MSLILDALNRAEQERNEKNHIPTLQSVHRYGDETPLPLWKRLHLERWLIALVVAYLVSDFVRGRMQHPEPVAPPSTGQAEVATKPPAETRVAATSPRVQGIEAPAAKETAAPPVPRTEQVTGVEARRLTPVEETPQLPIAAGEEVMPAVAGSAGADESSAGPAGSEQPGSSANQPDASQPDGGAQPGQAARREQEPVTLARDPKVESLYLTPPQARSAGAGQGASSNGASGSPRQRQGGAFMRTQQLTDLSLNSRHQIPTLKYSEHMPAERAADRHVVLNGNLYREGDTVAGGLRLIEISEPGIVLEYNGERFRLDAYNSWINFQ
jgi:general secretion pathway protein B